MVWLKRCGVASEDENDGDEIDMVKHNAYLIAGDKWKSSENPEFNVAERYQPTDGGQTDRLVGMQ